MTVATRQKRARSNPQGGFRYEWIRGETLLQFSKSALTVQRHNGLKSWKICNSHKNHTIGSCNLSILGKRRLGNERLGLASFPPAVRLVRPRDDFYFLG